MNELKFEVMQTPAVINVDFEEAKQQVLAKVDEYRGLVFTEEQKKELKDEMAGLRKYRKTITDGRSGVKKTYMEPFDMFNSQVNEILAIIDKAISYMDGQLKEIEEKRIQEKKAEIESAYRELVPDSLQDYIPLECIYGAKWDNATTNMKSIKKEIADTVTKTQSEISVISSMGSDKTEDALNLYMSNRDLACAIRYINDYETKKREILAQQEKREAERAEALRQEEIEKIRREERERIAEEERIRNEAKREAVEEIKTVDEAAAAPLAGKQSMKVIYTVVATKEALQEIEMAFNSLGIYYERKDV
ncbi:MAG: DUF1351 domain-containing protein [Lactobacillus sp.]|nr:DUF1351 domain-containing protein [Lactobacillus sp.]